VVTFLVKVKAHRGDPTNKRVDIQADEAVLNKNMEWEERTNRAIFTWKEPPRKGGQVSYDYRKSTWNNGVRKAIRLEVVENEVEKHRDHIIGLLRQISRLKRRADVSYDRSTID